MKNPAESDDRAVEGLREQAAEAGAREAECRRLSLALEEKRGQLLARDGEYRALGEELRSTEARLRAANEGLQVIIGELRHEVAERRRGEERIKQAASEWRATFDTIPDMISIHGRDFRLTRVNKAFAHLVKMEPAEIIGQPCCQLLHGTEQPAPRCPHLKSLATGRVVTEEFFEPHLGVYLEVATSPLFDKKGEAVASVHVARDVSERKKMDEQLIIADRLASIGELASGIAHELNNPLTSVIGFSQLLLKKGIPDDIREDLNIIVNEAQRGAEVVRNLLTFARRHASVKELVNLNDIIGRVLKLREYEQRVSNIQVITRLADGLPPVMGESFQLQQVFLNIILNAEYFMTAAHKGGTLTIMSEGVRGWVRVSLADDGPGIKPENLGRLFDPFFTTKEVGKGTGLGLSICHGIVTGHGGRISARSKPGRGATFTVELPVAPESDDG